MKKKIKILFVISSFSPGGAEMMLFKLLCHLDKKKYHPLVISLSDRNELSYLLVNEKINFKILCLSSMIKLPLVLFKLIKEIKKFKPNIVHTWMYHSDLIGGLAAKLSGVKKIIWSVRACEMDIGKIKFTTLIIRKICGIISKFIPNIILFNSKSAIKLHRKLGYSNSNLIYIPNGFDVNKFKPDLIKRNMFRKRNNISKNELVIGMVARYDPLKNNIGALVVLKNLIKKNFDCKMVFVGKDMDNSNSKFKKYINKLSLENNVILLGQLFNIENIMPAFDLLISPSHAEAFPNVVGEAMSCGIPCVVTDVGDCKNIIQNKKMVVKKNDMDGMADKIYNFCHLDSNQKDLIKKKLRKRISARFNILKIVNEIELIYRNI